MAPSSGKNLSTNFISTRWRAPPPSTIRKPSRWSSCAPPEFTRSAFMSMTARGRASTATTTPNRSAGRQLRHASNPKIWVMEEFKNSDTNHLGIALPKGKLRFYRRDTDGHLEFVGENTIDHTPKDETIRVYTGNSFDIVGERKRTNYHVGIKPALDGRNIRNSRAQSQERSGQRPRGRTLYRWTNWKLSEQSRLAKDGCADDRVSCNHCARRRAGGDVHRALFLVGDGVDRRGQAPASTRCFLTGCINKV